MWLRIITALVLAPAVILLTLYLPTHWLSVVFLVVALLGLYEWNRLTIRTTALFSCVALGLVAATWWLVNQPLLLFAITVLATLFWMYQIYRLQRFAYSKTATSDTRFGTIWAFFLGAFCLLGVWSALMLLHQQPQYGALATVALLVMVWSADCFAYFSGKAFGKHKLAPELSPNKTIEGVVGGLLGVCLIAVLSGWLVLNLSFPRLSVWIIAGLSIAIFSVVGDLYESRLKRLAGVKDSGHLLPGHGGILDRIDGVIAATPVFVTLLLM